MSTMTNMKRADIVGILRRNSDPVANAAFGHWALTDEQMSDLIADIVLECSRIAKLATGDNKVCDAIEQHFGLEDEQLPN